MKVLAIPVPRSTFNHSTGQWEAPGMEVPVKKPVVRAPTQVVFSGEHEPLATPWWGDLRADTPKCWKHQSKRNNQFYKRK